MPVCSCERIEVGVVVARFGRVDEPFDYLDEAGGVVVKRHVPGVLEDLKARAGNRLVGDPGMAYRDHEVVLAPNQLQRNGLHEIAAIQHGDELAAPVHH